MKMNLADQMLEIAKTHLGIVKHPNYVRAGIVLVQELQTFLLMKANQGIDINDITYDLGNPRFGYLAFVLSKVDVTPEEASMREFYTKFTKYVNHALNEEGIRIIWAPHQLKFEFIKR